MPIKFRCQHCEQFLGISKSRAGAIVDCPQCGRSVLVPELDGRVRRIKKVVPQNVSDHSLISALSELSSLEEDDVPNSATEQAVDVMSLSEPVDHQYEATKLHSVPASQPVDVPADWSEDVAEPEYSDFPIALSDSLAELASFDIQHSGGRDDSVISDELLRDMRSVRQSSWGVLSVGVVCGFALLLGLAVGWWLTESGRLKIPLPFGMPGQLKTQPAADRSANNQPAVYAQEAAGRTEQVVQGAVKYLNSAGDMLPDDGAMILLLPVQRVGALLFDARSLRQPKSHPDCAATLAALNSLGVKVVWANEAGLYAVAHEAMADTQVVVVSQHAQRPEDLSIPPDIELLLRKYFQSPNHVCGQLAVQVSEVSDSGSLDFQFDSQQ